jgi:hypothetical protein
MRTIDSISELGLVLFVDDQSDFDRERDDKITTTKGTERDCLDYGYRFIDGECYAFAQSIKSNFETSTNRANNSSTRGNVLLGQNHLLSSGNRNVAIGYDNTSIDNGMYSVVKGYNSYSENYGLNTFSALDTTFGKRANISETHYFATVPAVADGNDSEDIVEIFLGGVVGQRFYTAPKDMNAAYYMHFTGIAQTSDGRHIAVIDQKLHFFQMNTFLRLGEGSCMPCPMNIDESFPFQMGVRTEGISKGAAENFVGKNAIYVYVGKYGFPYSVNIRVKIVEVRNQILFQGNEILNPTFANNGQNWTTGNVVGNNTIEFMQGGGVKMVGDGTRNFRIRSNATPWLGSTVMIEFDAKGINGANPNILLNGNNRNIITITQEGRYRFMYQGTTGGNYIQFMINSTTGAGSGIINNVSFRKLSGYEI